jgi:hypothetical protein
MFQARPTRIRTLRSSSSIAMRHSTTSLFINLFHKTLLSSSSSHHLSNASTCLPRSFHASPALYALIRSTALKKKEDVFSLAQQEAKKGKLTSDKYVKEANESKIC